MIWGSLTNISAFLSRVVIEESPAHPIISVWRFGRDLRHLTNGEEEVLFHTNHTVMNLHKTRISLN